MLSVEVDLTLSVELRFERRVGTTLRRALDVSATNEKASGLTN